MKNQTLENMALAQLRKIAAEMEIPNAKRMKKDNLIVQIRHAQGLQEGKEIRGGVLEIMNEGIGFLRQNYQINPEDVYVSQAQLRRWDLRNGDQVIGLCRPPRESERHWGLVKVETINGLTPEEARNRKSFESMTPIFPDKRFDLENKSGGLATRLINLIAPIGRGQRGMIVSPPKAGKTTILKQIANAISAAYPEVHLIIALIGERPEEVTDMDRSVDAEVVASTFDEPVTQHVRTSEITLERAKRLVENGKDVVILLDSITRLARAYNTVTPASGKVLSGGVDANALHKPKKFFGAARNIENGGSLTIIATALIDTGSKMDEVIFEEFKGTGNMEVRMSRRVAEKRVFPAIDITGSGTRREDLLLSRKELDAMEIMRKAINGARKEDAVETILNMFAHTKSNDEYIDMIIRKRVI